MTQAIMWTIEEAWCLYLTSPCKHTRVINHHGNTMNVLSYNLLACLHSKSATF